jgi:Icc protein
VPHSSPISQPLRLLQFTDTHLLADRQGRLLGLNTHESLKCVLDLSQKNHRQPDLVLVTGDLVHDGSDSGYAHLQEYFRTFDVPVLLLAGNHDEARQLRDTTSSGPARLAKQIERGGWQIVLLDSSIPGNDGGRLAAAELALLDKQLSAAPALPALVCLHHQPVPMGSRWLDTMVLENAGEFFAVLDRHPQVRGVLWGHVHQEYDDMRNGVRLLATPSTCFQFKPHSIDFALDATAPGYRWLDLHPDGRIDSGVCRLARVSTHLDMQSSGY